ncbi:hypothetical protein E2562_025343, partial [Oryza meyeriana var. granulata]
MGLNGLRPSKKAHRHPAPSPDERRRCRRAGLRLATTLRLSPGVRDGVPGAVRRRHARLRVRS